MEDIAPLVGFEIRCSKFWGNKQDQVKGICFSEELDSSNGTSGVSLDSFERCFPPGKSLSDGVCWDRGVREMHQQSECCAC